jgi:NADPH2:quinone reductase
VIGLNLGGYHEHEPETLRQASAALFALYAAGGVRPLIHAQYPLARAADALGELAARRTVGKLILVP